MDALNKQEKAIQLLKTDMIREYELICSNQAKYMENVFLTLIDRLCNKEFINIAVSKIKEFDYYTYIHSVRVGVYSMSIGFIMGYDEQFIIEIGAAGLLHDIGKKFLPNEIINKKGDLSSLEFSIIQAHVAMSAYYIQNKCHFENTNIVSGVYQHHERLDGSGYPRHLLGDEISIPGKIIAIADVFEAYSSNRAYHEARTVEKTIGFMLELNGLDTDIMNKFISRINVETSKIEF